MNYYALLFAIINTLIILVYVYDLPKKKKLNGLIPLVASFVASAIVIFLLNEAISETIVYFILNFAVLFSILPFYYLRSNRKLLLFLLVMLLEFVYVVYAYGYLLYPFMQMFAIGTTFGAIYRSGFEVFNKDQGRMSIDIETKRDIVHLLLGILILSVFISFPFYYAVYITAVLILIGYIYNSAIGKYKPSRVYKFLNSLERPEALFGMGALYLAVGAALLVGFVHNLHFIVIGFTALLLADPIATIIGMGVKGPKLFYNKKKSLYGSLAFFFVVALIGLPFIGFYSILFGIVLAGVESIKSPVDDNISISIAMVILYIIFLGSVNMLPFF